MSDLLDKALALADAVSVEAYARINRDEIEAQIAASLIGTPNPETGKPHSATSARAAAASTDEAKAAHVAIIAAERETIMARAHYEQARISAWAGLHEVTA